MRIVLLQRNPLIGDQQANTDTLLTAYAEHAESADLVVAGELALTGYYPYDLLERADILVEEAACLKKIAEATAGKRAALAVGCIRKNPFGAGKPLHNSLAVFESGVRIFTYDKRLLPTYNIFDEARHFEPGRTEGVLSFRGARLGFLICEDGWNHDALTYGIDPVASLAEQEVDLVVSVNASPSNVGKQKARLARFGQVARACRAPLAYVNQWGGNDETVFDGASFALAADGAPLGLAESFADADVALELNDGRLVASHGLVETEPLGDTELMLAQAICGLRDYVEKCGFPSVVVGSSGGIDSALTLALAVDALGPERVLAVSMPSRFSSTGSVDDSKELCANLGIPLYSRPIVRDMAVDLEEFEKSFGRPPEKPTVENMQARHRGRILMEVANDFGSLVLSTGNASELAVGYCTLYGDTNGGLNLLGGMYKTEVYALARAYNHKRPERSIPRAILTKEPSAELSEDQKDSDSLPPYPILDAILKMYIEGDQLPKTERDLLTMTLRGVADAEIARVIHLVNGAEFKRRQAPPIIRLQRRTFGRGRQLPIAARYPKACGLPWLAGVHPRPARREVPTGWVIEEARI